MKLLLPLLFSCIVMLGGLSHADEATPLLYTRTNIVIKRAYAPMPTPMPWQQPEEVLPAPDLVLDVEVRDAATLYNQKGWYNLSSPSDKNGVLLVFSAPTIASLPRASQYSPLDILMIDKEGTIKQIAPNLLLADLQEDIYPKDPVLAFLFMRGGACAKQGINPGDNVEYKIFTKPPPILSAPPPAAATPAPAPVTPASTVPTNILVK